MGEGRRGWRRRAAASRPRVRRRRVGRGGGAASLRHMLQLPPPLHCVCWGPARRSRGEFRELWVWGPASAGAQSPGNLRAGFCRWNVGLVAEGDGGPPL